MGTQAKQYCAIGSVKTNIGHLDVAAGAAGLIKTALSLHNKIIPANLHFSKPNPKLEIENSPFYVNGSLQEWKAKPGFAAAGGYQFLWHWRNQCASSGGRIAKLLPRPAHRGPGNC